MDYLIGGAVVAIFWVLNVAFLQNKLRFRLAGFTTYAMRVLHTDQEKKSDAFLLLCIAEQAIFKSSKAFEAVLKSEKASELTKESYARQIKLEEVVYNATTDSILSLKGVE